MKLKMKTNEFIEKWESIIRNGVNDEALDNTLQDLKDDVMSLNIFRGELQIEEIETLYKALKWVGMSDLEQRDLFMIISVYLRVHDKQEKFSLKDAEELFERTEKIYKPNNRAVYGGLYYYINESLNICEGYDKRDKTNNVHYRSGNYNVSKKKLIEMVSKILIER